GGVGQESVHRRPGGQGEGADFVGGQEHAVFADDLPDTDLTIWLTWCQSWWWWAVLSPRTVAGCSIGGVDSVRIGVAGGFDRVGGGAAGACTGAGAATSCAWVTGTSGRLASSSGGEGGGEGVAVGVDGG